MGQKIIVNRCLTGEPKGNKTEKNIIEKKKYFSKYWLRVFFKTDERNQTTDCLPVKMMEEVNAVLTSSLDHIKIKLNCRTIIIENHLKST